MYVWRVRVVIDSLLHRTSASESKVKTLSGELTEAKHSLTISDVKRESLREELDRIMSRNLRDGERDVRLVGLLVIIVMTTTKRRTFVIVILVTGTMIRMNPIVLVVLRMVSVVGWTLVSKMILTVVKENAMIFIVRIVAVITTIPMAVPPGAALVVKCAGS